MKQSIAQGSTFDIYGTMSGDFKNKIYLFFENDFSHRDSLKATIDKAGKFHFKLQNKLPILCRIYCGDKSNILEFYIDSLKTFLTLNSILTEKEIADSLGGSRVNLSFRSIIGSKTQNTIASFQEFSKKLYATEQNAQQNAQALHDKYFAELTRQVKKNHNNKASLYLIAGRIYFLGRGFLFPNNLILSSTEIETLSKLIDRDLNTTLEYQNLQKIKEVIQTTSHRALNEPFYHADLVDTLGEIVATKNFPEKYVLLDFWASWCKPCRASIPKLKKLYDSYKDKGFTIVNISIDENMEVWKKAVSAEQMPWTQLIDTLGIEGPVCKYYDIRAVPTQILLNKKGQVIAFPNNSNLEEILNKNLKQ
jgi:thiol-disulfide isomerase/thioredoxin